MNKKLDALRQEMKKENIQAYIVPTSDDHDTEYVCSHFMSRSYLSGFTGSAGTLVVGLDQAALWTDGRYFIQAKDQLAGSGIVGIAVISAIFAQQHITQATKDLKQATEQMLNDCAL